MLEKKQLSYIILFVCIWSEDIIFFENVFTFFCQCLCLRPAKEKNKKKHICITIIYSNIYIIYIYILDMYKLY